MKKYSVLIATTIFIVGISLNASHAQLSIDELEPENYFDFWLGEWELTWEDADGNKGQGTNHIERVLDGKVIKKKL